MSAFARPLFYLSLFKQNVCATNLRFGGKNNSIHKYNYNVRSVKSLANTTNLSGTEMENLYTQTKNKFISKKLPKDVDEVSVFACNELDLNEVKVYGFDYDYTLACYTPELENLLYNLASEVLIKRYKYPKIILDMKYDPNFAVRGLHYDVEKGLLLKLDSFLQIQLGSVYRGRSKVSEDEVRKYYKNRVLPISYVEGANNAFVHNMNAKMVQLADVFSVPEMCLLCNVIESFMQNGIDYSPEIVFQDIKTAMGSSHPVMHRTVISDPAKYLEHRPKLGQYLDKLHKAGKTLFLVTNSPFKFVNTGMSYLIPDWREKFDVVITQARKPKFFTDETHPIRIFDEQSKSHLWDRVTKLEKGKIYYEGNVKQLQDLKGWQGHNVLYFGDHPYSDLADVILKHSWRTCAIIRELEYEIKTLNGEDFKKASNWLQMLTQLIENTQDNHSEGALKCLRDWMKERDELRNMTKDVFNKQFGSVFRTHHNPTYFSRRLFRFADVYTSDVMNFSKYSMTHTFYPRRGVMPHEYESYFI